MIRFMLILYYGLALFIIGLFFWMLLFEEYSVSFAIWQYQTFFAGCIAFFGANLVVLKWFEEKDEKRRTKAVRWVTLRNFAVRVKAIEENYTTDYCVAELEEMLVEIDLFMEDGNISYGTKTIAKTLRNHIDCIIKAYKNADTKIAYRIDKLPPTEVIQICDRAYNSAMKSTFRIWYQRHWPCLKEKYFPQKNNK